MTTDSTRTSHHWWQSLVASLYFVGLFQALYLAISTAFKIRLFAIEEYGRVIHEFDPYFNYRATEYLGANGWQRFVTWFDYQSWYPLGRPVGTTIYPGLQVTSVFIRDWILPSWSINDICCFVPAWFGALATLATAALAYECSIGVYGPTGGVKAASDETVTTGQNFGSILGYLPIVKQLYKRIIIPVRKWLNTKIKTSIGFSVPSILGTEKLVSSPAAIESAVATACIMAILPAHLMRSVGGGYDNESIAMTAMAATFWCWTRSLRDNTILWPILTALAYYYMVAAWGGYVFVLNCVGVHAGLLAITSPSQQLYKAYTIVYGLGTFLATTVPVVGWTPLKSLEQMGPLLVFGYLQLIQVCRILEARQRRLATRNKPFTIRQAWQLRLAVFGVAVFVAGIIAFVLAQRGYFGPISARVRGLFVKHTKTGNPLVDSVAEHQPARPEAYFQYLDVICYVTPVGFAMVALFGYHDSSSFLIVFGATAYYFSNKMVRLILLTAPISAVLSGMVIGHLLAWGMQALLGEWPSVLIMEGVGFTTPTITDTIEAQQAEETTTQNKKKNGGKKKKIQQDDVGSTDTSTKSSSSTSFVADIIVRVVRVALIAYLAFWAKPFAESFHSKCFELSKALSHPTIIQKAMARSPDGSQTPVTVDDYREAYWWLRDNTPEDARVMAWWDYGYQIAGIANRTTIADGNTWNHEHIALLGRALTSSEKEGHRIARHLADYILIWAGGGGDDLAKSPHMRRIANSVYRFLCPKDPTCRSFGITSRGEPSPTLRKSLLFTLHSHRLIPGVEADKNRFRLVFESKYKKVRIFKVLSVSRESRNWAADPNNRICDAPGSWFCRGQYPPGLKKVLKQKKDFQQLEDFNVAGEDDSEYQRQYMEYLNNPEKVKRDRREHLREKMEDDTGAIDPESLVDPEELAHPQVKKLMELSQRDTPPTKKDIDDINSLWDDTPITTELWNMIHTNDIQNLGALLGDAPHIGHIRSKDGRGPMFWAHEEGRVRLVELLKSIGVSETVQDASGLTPLDISKL